MCGVCAGVQIVTPDFLDACGSAGHLLDGKQFTLKDPVCEAAFSTSRGLENVYKLEPALQIVREKGRLLRGFSVFCLPSLSKRTELPELVVAAGGTLLHAAPEPGPKVLVLGERSSNDATEKEVRARTEVYAVDLLYEAAFTQRMRYSAYRLR